MGQLTPIIITAVLTPIAATLVGYLATRVGLTKKTKELEYLNMRIEVLQKLVGLAVNGNKCNILENLVSKETSAIIEKLELNSISQSNDFRYEFDKKPVFLRLVTVPKPRTFGGWVGAVLFYIYLFYSVFLPILAINNDTFFEGKGALFIVIMSMLLLLFSYFCRYVTVCSTKLVFLENQLLANKSIQPNAEASAD